MELNNILKYNGIFYKIIEKDKIFITMINLETKITSVFLHTTVYMNFEKLSITESRKYRIKLLLNDTLENQKLH